MTSREAGRLLKNMNNSLRDYLDIREVEDEENKKMVAVPISPLSLRQAKKVDPGSYKGVDTIMKDISERHRKRKQENEVHVCDGSPAKLEQNRISEGRVTKKYVRLGPFHTMAIVIRCILFIVISSMPIVFKASGCVSKKHNEYVCNCKNHRQSRDFVLNLRKALFFMIITQMKNEGRMLSGESFYSYLNECQTIRTHVFAAILFRVTSYLAMAYEYSRVDDSHRMNVSFELFDPFLLVKPGKYGTMRAFQTITIRRVKCPKKRAVLECADLVPQRSGRKVNYKGELRSSTQPTDASLEEDNWFTKTFACYGGAAALVIASILFQDAKRMVVNNSKIFQTERKLKFDPNTIMSRIAPYNDITVLNMVGALMIADIEGDQGIFDKEWKFVSKDEEGEGISEYLTQFYPTLLDRHKKLFKRSKEYMVEAKRIPDIKKYSQPMVVNGTMSDADFYVDEESDEEEEEDGELDDEDLDDVAITENNNNNNNNNLEAHEVKDVRKTRMRPDSKFHRFMKHLQNGDLIPCTCKKCRIVGVGDTLCCDNCGGYVVEHTCAVLSRDSDGKGGFDLCCVCVMEDDNIFCKYSKCKDPVFEDPDDLEKCANCGSYVHLGKCSLDCDVTDLRSQKYKGVAICLDCDLKFKNNNDKNQNFVIHCRQENELKQSDEKTDE